MKAYGLQQLRFYGACVLIAAPSCIAEAVGPMFDSQCIASSLCCNKHFIQLDMLYEVSWQVMCIHSL